LENKVVIITGASSGIGAAVARRLGKAGMRLTLAARRIEKLEAVAEDVRKSGGEALVVPTDVTNQAETERMVQRTMASWGRVDVLFNNAGVSLNLPFVDWKSEQIANQVNTNLLAVMRCAHAVLPVMIKQKSGHIINNSSIAGLVAVATVYSATKFGVVGFSEALRRELFRTGVKVSAFCPGFTPSELSPNLSAHAEGRTDTTWYPGLMPVCYVADQVAWLIEHPRRVHVIPKSWRILVLTAHLFPGLVDRVVPWVKSKNKKT
jgi:NADP-dependent 3-hydroxy acid dehydrogenase YdfG